MRFIDTKEEYNYFKKEIEESRDRVINSGRFLLSKETEALEKNFSKLIVPDMYSTSVKNCTDALIIVLDKICKKNPNAPIVLPNFGAYPTAIAAANISNNIFYVDVDDTYTIDANKLPDLKDGVIVPVHLFGNNCNMEKIVEYANLNNFTILEDCAQSTGSGSGNIGNYSVFSFYPTKPLSSMGDGGMICSKNNDDHEWFKKYRFYGQDYKTRKAEFVGINSRIDEFQAAIVNCKMEKYQGLNNKRIEIAKRYKENIKGMTARGRCVYHQFPVRFEKRNTIERELSKRSIPYMIHYENHVTDFKFLNFNGCNVTNKISNDIISLPCHPFMKESDIQKVEEFLNEFKSQEKT